MTQPVAEVGGITIGWWYRPGLLAAVYSGESQLFARPSYRTAYLHDSVPEGRGVAG